MPSKPRKRRTAITAPMLEVNNSKAIQRAKEAIANILATKQQAPETLQEAMRTLAVIARAPDNVTISGCTFRGSA